MDCGAGGGALVVLGSIRVRNDEPLRDQPASNQARMCESSVVQAANPICVGRGDYWVGRTIDRSIMREIVSSSFL